MAGAAISPTLSITQEHWKDYNPFWIQMLSSIPALFIILILTNKQNQCDSIRL